MGIVSGSEVVFKGKSNKIVLPERCYHDSFYHKTHSDEYGDENFCQPHHESEYKLCPRAKAQAIKQRVGLKV